MKINSRGFTLLEIILTIFIVAMIATIVYLNFSGSKRSSEFDVAFSMITDSFFKAQNKAQTGEKDSAWGLKFLSSSNDVIIFKGPTYDSRDPAFDEKRRLPDSVSVTGLEEVRFNKFIGQPHTLPAVNVTSTIINKSRCFTINAKGTLIYQSC